MSDILLIRKLPNKRKISSKRTIKVTIDPEKHKININRLNHSNTVQKLVEEQMKMNGYKRNEDPLIKEIKKLADKYHVKLS